MSLTCVDTTCTDEESHHVSKLANAIAISKHVSFLRKRIVGKAMHKMAEPSCSLKAHENVRRIAANSSVHAAKVARRCATEPAWRMRHQ